MLVIRPLSASRALHGWQGSQLTTAAASRPTLRTSSLQRGGAGVVVCNSSGLDTPATLSDSDRATSQDGAGPHHHNGAAEHHAAVQAVAKAGGLRVTVKGVHKRYNTKRGQFHAVRGVDVVVKPGTMMALLGPSGSGKTTLLRMIAGLEEVSEGRIFFDDVDATEMPVQDRRVGMVFQSYALFKHMNLLDNIMFGMRMRRLHTEEERRRRAEELLELVKLPGYGSRFPPQLSGGQRQRVAVARALASEPRVLLMDEPFGALDPIVRTELRTQLRELQQELGLTTIIVTHDQEEAFDIADEVVVFNRGEIEQVGTPAEVVLRPQTPFVMNFVGDVNIVPRDCLLIRKLGFRTDKEMVLVRPGDLVMFRIGEEPAGETRLCPAVVTEKIHMGWLVHYKLRFDDNVSVEWLVPRDDDDEIGGLSEEDRVYLHVDPARLMGADERDIDAQIGKR